ncbi:hypothetical protein H0H92_004222 [Tricholoma furcatifolium]|nr:hypothetical protein H0H92_004222 [Tricholoma furcatifolium]
MSFAKSKLKAAREALGKKDYQTACDASSQVLDYEPDNYNATVFLALSLLELGQYEKSEQIYQRATSLNPENPLAWQGISKYYERREEWEKYADSLLRLIELYKTLDDLVKCAESWQKLLELRRKRGTRLQVIEVLSLLLPHSPLYDALSALPVPNLTNPTSTTTLVAQTAVHHSLPHIEEVVRLVEIQEEETAKKEVEKRRTRLGAPSLEILKNEVGREVWGTSNLPTLYEEILNHPSTSDDLRRSTDAKLLRYKERYLHSIPNTPDFAQEKTRLLSQVDDMVKGVVILRIPDELAWSIYLEGLDCETVAGYDHTFIRQFIEQFPLSPASSLLRGYFLYMNIPLRDTDAEDDDEPVVKVEDEDAFDIILNAFTAIPNTTIANRVLAELYLAELDYENAIKVAESGLELLNRLERNTGRKLPGVRIGYKVILATSLVHLFPPKHHLRALRLIDDVLSQSPDNVHCLMGRAFILQAASKWEEAATLFARVDELLPDDLSDGIRAREESVWCRCQVNDVNDYLPILESIVVILQGLDERGEDTARCLWRIGKCYWEMNGKSAWDASKREEGYRFFISSLKSNPSYAPAFTSLGIYYAEYATPLDPNRASKCFQKAFELDPREAEAARRLAQGFAEDREWDLVDVVARRTIEGEGGLNAGMESASMRYLPTNAWAWKAVGAVELHRRNYPPAIEAFQVALRAEPEDALSWARLGECYGKAGRHVAAVKALERAHELDPDDWVCSYLIGDVKHQMGNYPDAIAAFESIFADRPTDVGVLISLGQAYLDLGRAELSEGFQSRAEQSFATCISVGLKTTEASAGFRGIVWKTIGDAIYALSARSTYTNEGGIRDTLEGVIALLPAENAHLTGLVAPAALSEDTTLSGLKVLEIALAAYSYRTSLGQSESTTTSGSAWYDLGMALHSWAIKSPGPTTAAEAKIVEFLTQALREDPGNSLYWIGLGDAYFLSNAKSAQHAYVKAIEFDSKNAVAWTSLGLLYLHHDDVELANEALYRAQTLDPDYAVAWIGQALVAMRNGHEVEAAAMFEHAIGLTPNIPEGDLEFASRSFYRYRVSSFQSGTRALDTLLPAFFALDRYCGRRPDDATGLHLYSLVCESLGHLETSVSQLMRTIAILEAAYEVSEDPVVERQFTIANSNLARVRLALGDWDGAEQAFASALGLLPEEDASGDGETRVLRVQANFGCGIAAFLKGDLESALGSFEAAMESVGDDKALRGQVTVLLAQTMWATQNEEFKESSKAQLLECIAADPENLMAINTLAGMGVLTDDESLVDAALSELLALPREQRYDRDPGRNVDHLLTQYHLGQGDTKKAVAVMQGALFSEPSRIECRASLARVMIQEEKYDAALALLEGTSSKEVGVAELPTLLSLRAVALVATGNKDEAMHAAQRAVMLMPSDTRCWQALALVRSRAG